MSENVERPKATTHEVLGGTCTCVLCGKVVNKTEAYSLTGFDPVCQGCFETAHPEAKR